MARASAPTSTGPRFRTRLLVQSFLILVTLGAGAVLAAIPVTDLLDQRAELSEVETERDELLADIKSIELEIEHLTGADGIQQRGRCFGPYVKPGEETYAIPGVDGCASGS